MSVRPAEFVKSRLVKYINRQLPPVYIIDEFKRLNRAFRRKKVNWDIVWRRKKLNTSLVKPLVLRIRRKDEEINGGNRYSLSKVSKAHQTQANYYTVPVAVNPIPFTKI